MDEQLRKNLIAVAQEDYEGDDWKIYEIVEDGEWVQDHKYQSRSTIIKYQDKFYSVDQNRSGSYWTDWDYDDYPDVYEVERVEVLTKIWQPV